MELRQLRYFLSVAENRSFVSAANNLYITRQAVSKAISQLESELCVELFSRDSSGAYLTPAGILFYEQIRAILADLDNAYDQLRSGGSRYHQRIRIGFSVGTLQLLEDALLHYRETTENVEVSYSEQPEEECLHRLAEHRDDLVIGTVEQTDNNLFCEELYRSRIGLLLQEENSLGELDELDVRDLTWIPLAGHSDSQIDAFCRKHELTLQYQGYDYHRLLNLTASGKCGLLLPECMIPQNLSRVCWLPLQQEEYWRIFKIYPRFLEKNLLYSAALDDFDSRVLQHIRN